MTTGRIQPKDGDTVRRTDYPSGVGTVTHAGKSISLVQWTTESKPRAEMNSRLAFQQAQNKLAADREVGETEPRTEV